MKNSQYVKNSVESIKECAKQHGYRVEFYADDINFYFKIYEKKFFGLYNKLVQDFIGVWDGIVYNFDNVWEDVHRCIISKYKYNYDA